MRVSNKLSRPSWEALREHLDAGRDLIVGIDEVGRGALAGPVVAAAVILPARLMIEGVNDSKLVSHARRETLDRTIRRQALAVGIGWVAAAEVDEHGLTWAVTQSGRRALLDLDHDFHRIILDGSSNYLAPEYPSEALIRADSLVVPVAAASIVAKVARDKYMSRLSSLYPAYGFDRHVGYGTVAHRMAIEAAGPCSVHRTSFAPLKGGQ